MKKNEENNSAVFTAVLSLGFRPLVAVPHRHIDQTIETVQGKSDTVQKLYQDYVLGKLDMSQIAGSPVYDAEGSDVVDDFNHFGVTLEEATAIEDRGRAAAREIDAARKPKKPDTPPATPPDNPPKMDE